MIPGGNQITPSSQHKLHIFDPASCIKVTSTDSSGNVEFVQKSLEVRPLQSTNFNIMRRLVFIEELRWMSIHVFTMGKGRDIFAIHIQPSSIKIWNDTSEHLDGLKAMVGQSMGLGGFIKRTFVFKEKIKRRMLCWEILLAWPDVTGNMLAPLIEEIQPFHPGWWERILGNLNEKKKVREGESRKKITKDVKTQTYMPLGHHVLYYWASNHPSPRMCSSSFTRGCREICNGLWTDLVQWSSIGSQWKTSQESHLLFLCLAYLHIRPTFH